MNGKNDLIEKKGVFFAEPENYKKPKKVFFQEAVKYIEKVRKEENREVTFEEMQKFVVR